MNRYRTGPVILIAPFLAGLLGTASVSANEYRAADPANDIELSARATFIMQGLLGEMGMKLPDEEKRIDPPPPSPEPSPPEPQPTPPQPGPSPEPQPDNSPDDSGDGFFDDDFFDDEVSFDDAVKQMDDEFDSMVAKWDEEYEKTVEAWEKARVEYLKKEDEYRQSTVEGQRLGTSGQTFANTTPPRFKADISAMQAGSFYVIPGAMDLAVKDQGTRGTCAAFAAVRAMETLMMQNGVATDFSEEHFYFMSKPKCQQSPCGKDEEGSSLLGGLNVTKNASNGALLPEANCHYKPRVNDSNITNTPLRDCRPGGVIRASRFGELTSFDAVLNELRNNNPVVAGYGLSRNYQTTRGLVKLNDPLNTEEATGPHAPGHANLLIGYIKLPPSLRNEGDYCVIAANSWTDGWGRGGYACLTEAWLKKGYSLLGTVQSVVMTDAGLDYYRIR